MSSTTSSGKTALIVGASRTLGLALTTEYLERGWNVIATVRGDQPDALVLLQERSGTRLAIEKLDMTDRSQLFALRDRLQGTVLDLLFVNAGITNKNVPFSEVPTEDFIEVMVTNALSPMRVVEDLASIVASTGTIAVMTSRQGSLTLNTRGGHEVYRASKSALNQLMRSFAALRHDDPRTLLLIHPGWVKTDLGGLGAPLDVEQSAHSVVDVVEQQSGHGGLQFLDYQGEVLPW